MTRFQAERKLTIAGLSADAVREFCENAYTAARNAANRYIDAAGNPLDYGRTADEAEKVFDREFDSLVEIESSQPR